MVVKVDMPADELELPERFVEALEKVRKVVDRIGDPGFDWEAELTEIAKRHASETHPDWKPERLN